MKKEERDIIVDVYGRLCGLNSWFLSNDDIPPTMLKLALEDLEKLKEIKDLIPPQ